MILRIILVSLSVASLSGCGEYVSRASGVTNDGTEWVGTTTVSMKKGVFAVTGGGVTCDGSYDPFDNSESISATFVCSDGSSGTIDVVREKNKLGGRGLAKFSNGREGVFVFGN